MRLMWCSGERSGLSVGRTWPCVSSESPAAQLMITELLSVAKVMRGDGGPDGMVKPSS